MHLHSQKPQKATHEMHGLHGARHLQLTVLIDLQFFLGAIWWVSNVELQQIHISAVGSSRFNVRTMINGCTKSQMLRNLHCASEGAACTGEEAQGIASGLPHAYTSGPTLSAHLHDGGRPLRRSS